MTATTNRLGLAEMRALPLGTGGGTIGWRPKFQTMLDNLEDRLTLTATRNPNQHKVANFIGQHCFDPTNRKAYAAMAVGTASQLNLFFELQLASNTVTATKNQNWTAGQRAAPATATTPSTVTLNFNQRNNFAINATQNITLANPTNVQAGQSGVIVFKHVGAVRSLSGLGTYWNSPGATGINLSTGGAGKIDVIPYYVINATHIHAVVSKDSRR